MYFLQPCFEMRAVLSAFFVFSNRQLISQPAKIIVRADKENRLCFYDTLYDRPLSNPYRLFKTCSRNFTDLLPLQYVLFISLE